MTSLARRVRSWHCISRDTLPYWLFIVVLVIIVCHIRLRNSEDVNRLYTNEQAVPMVKTRGIMDNEQGSVTVTKHQRLFDTPAVDLTVGDSENKILDTKNFGPDDGYARAQYLRHVCNDDVIFKDQTMYKGNVHVIHDNTHNYNALFCPQCNMASTFWARVFERMSINRTKKQGTPLSKPFDVLISEALGNTHTLHVGSDRIDNQIDASNLFRFVFVRNPYEMLFSTFVDKLVGPDPSYWQHMGVPASRDNRNTRRSTCGSDVTFPEFLHHIAYTNRLHKAIDCQLATFESCQPCAINYSYIGKVETFKNDSIHILSKMNLTLTLDVFERNFSELYADDAINNAILGPFSWKQDIVRCISWPEALRRIWRKLQIFGYIGASGFPLTDSEAFAITEKDFKHVIMHSRRQSTFSERQELKRLAYLEAYREVPLSVVDDVRKVYMNDFKLFNYNDHPEDIFNAPADYVYHGVLNYSNIGEGIIPSWLTT